MIIKSKGKAKVVQSVAFDNDLMYIQYGYLNNQRIEIYKLKNGKWTYFEAKDYKQLGHANGLTVCGKYLYSVRGHSRVIKVIDKETLKIVKTIKAPIKTVGAIGYNGKEWCFSCGKYLCYGTLKRIRKVIKKKSPFKYQQDLCYWKEYVFNCISVNKKINYIHIYKNGKIWRVLKNVYNGYELESCAVDKNGELYVLLNKRHKTDDRLVKVKWK